MARSRVALTAFNGGELTPLLDARVDQDKYFVGCREQSNFIPTVQGPARRRGGTRHLGVTKPGGGRAWLADFVFSSGQAYILELGHLYLRFWVNRGQLQDGGAPYAVVTPYTADDLITADGTFALQMFQSADRMWITHIERKHPPYRLSRNGATSWTLENEIGNIVNGPFKTTNADQGAATVTASGTTVTATVTLTASSALFLAGHVGGLLLLEDENPQNVHPFQTYQSVAEGDQVRNGGNVYRAMNDFTYVSGDQTQRYVPTHTEGEAYDGAVTWKYLHSGYGHVRITAVASDGLTATAVVLAELPLGVSAAPTYRWAFGEFSSAYGWPAACTYYKGRLAYFRGLQGLLSVNGDFTDFSSRIAGEVNSETAISVAIAADRLDSIRWAVSARGLLLGSASAELTLQEQTPQAVFSATNIQSVMQTEYGSRLLRPLRVGESVLFVERAGHRVREARYSFDIDRYKAEDVTVLSEHLFDGSELTEGTETAPRFIVDWAYQQQRDSLVWCVMSDGTLNMLVYNRERGVVAWTPHYIGGDAFVEAVRVIPSPDGTSDDAWFIVRRTVGGVTQRSVEYMTDYRLVKYGAAEAVHVDGSATYRGAATAVIGGLSHLEGKEVSVCVDGSNHPDRVVSGGQITLDRAGALVHVGYRYRSRLKTMRLELQGGAGTSQTARKGIGKTFVRLMSTIGARFGASFTKMDEMRTLNPKAPVGTPPALFSGDYEIDFPEGLGTDGYICIEQDKPLPCSVVGIFPRAQVYD